MSDATPLLLCMPQHPLKPCSNCLALPSHLAISLHPLQVAALLYYVASYFPGGASGAQFMLGFLGRSFGQACGACTRLVLGGSRG